MLGTNHEHGEAAGDETSSPSPLDLALRYIRRGWNPVPIPFKAKRPIDKGWQERVITAENAPQFFNGQAQNIGIILGPASGGLTDVDLDCPEAIAVAPDLLPETHAVFGRQSKPRSHYLYRTSLAQTAGKAALRFQDPTDNAVLVELRVGGKSGAQTVFPGSVHESGEAVIRTPADGVGRGFSGSEDADRLKGHESGRRTMAHVADHLRVSALGKQYRFGPDGT